MLTRRQFIATAAMAPLAACAADDDYDATVAATYAPLDNAPDLREFARYATLAANGHNTQPWRFSLGESTAAILPDFTRRTPIVDPDDHHLYVGLGCAAENFALAAGAGGRPAAIAFDTVNDRVAIDLATAPSAKPEMFAAIPHRQCTRSPYDGRAVSAADLSRLEQAAKIDGVDLILITDDQRKDQLLEQVVAANTAQMDDPAFVKELRDWIRFNPIAAIASRDGLYTGASGNPTIPDWLAPIVFRFAFTKRAENAKYAEHVGSAAGIAVFVGRDETKASWVDVGRAYQRFALQATAMGIRNAHLNQPIEVQEIRPGFADWLGIGERRPDLVVRFGYADPLPRSLRRPVSDVLV